MKKFILPIFVFVVLLSSYALGTVAHWIKLDNGEKTKITKTKHLSYDEVLKINKSGNFKNEVNPKAKNIYFQEIEVTRKKGVLGWKNDEKVLERYIKSIEE